jgi:hypothetical protein
MVMDDDDQYGTEKSFGRNSQASAYYGESDEIQTSR